MQTFTRQFQDADEDGDPQNTINSVSIENGAVVRATIPLPEAAFYQLEDQVEYEGIESEESVGAADSERIVEEKIHPLLRLWARERRFAREQILISFHDDLPVPRFPDLYDDQPRDSQTNQQILAEVRSLIAEITDKRKLQNERLTQFLKTRDGVRLLDGAWLVRSLLIEAPLYTLDQIARYPEVAYLEPRFPREEPPGALPRTTGPATVADGRASIGSDPYLALPGNMNAGSIALLDTGVRVAHTLLSAPSNVGFQGDCVNGGKDCNTVTQNSLNPDDDWVHTVNNVSHYGHGTATAAIINGNDRLGNSYQGVTSMTVDSYKVYTLTSLSLDVAAAKAAFQTAIAARYPVIVAQIQDNANEQSPLSKLADAAYDAGTMVLAANGNGGNTAGSVRAPANAHKVIAIGCFDITDNSIPVSQGRGPTRDGRIKPDLQAPTNTETASTYSTSALGILGATSGAVPYAAGAAVLLRNHLKGQNHSIDPGQVYAALLLAGKQPYPFNCDSGAGPLQLPSATDGKFWWGKVIVRRFGNVVRVDVPISMTGPTLNHLKGTLWWPESNAPGSFGKHNEIHLEWVDPVGVIQASSTDRLGVFQKAHVDGAVAQGTWHLRIAIKSVLVPRQVVYWAVHVNLR